MSDGITTSKSRETHLKLELSDKEKIMSTNKIDFGQDLNTLIRLNTVHDFADATALAKKVLSPFKAELDRETHKFSIELFSVATLFILNGQKNPSLMSVLECITDPKHGTERQMLDTISKNSLFSARRNNWSFFEASEKKAMCMSKGVAERKVLQCNAQWRKAFSLPANATPTKNIKNAMDFPIRNSIRIDTKHELSDAVALAAAVLNPVKDEVDNITFEFARELFVAAALDVARNTRSPVMNELKIFLIDPGWDDHKQITAHLGNGTGSTQKNTNRFFASLGPKLWKLSESQSKYLINRSHALWVRAFVNITKGKSATPKVAKLSAIQSNIQVFASMLLAERCS